MISVPGFRINAYGLILAAALAASRAGADDYAGWSKSARLYLKTTPDGANVTGAVAGFPILVRLTAANFDFSQASGQGKDIRFAAADGGHLPYQIERWDAAHGLAEVWVKLEGLAGNSVDSLTMLWGNAGAADSSDGKAVFDSAQGYVGVWHLGGSGTARKNSVRGGADGDGVHYDGNESATGIIGLADSLDDDPPSPDNLQIGDGYAELADGFTFSIWCYPVSAANGARLFDFGNGGGLDEMVLYRSGTSQSIVYDNYQSNVKGRSTKVDNCFPLKQWQQFAVTVAGNKMNLYRNGSLIASDDNAGNAITPVRRAFNYFGRNDWAAGEYYKGLLDEPQLSRVARSADWIKLSYANQGPVQNLVFFTRPTLPNTCHATFTMPKDTSLSEGSTLMLSGSADCATGFDWSAVAGPAPRILDPEAKALQVFLPRIAHDTSLIYRFTATYPDSEHHQDVIVSIKADIPDPAFTLPARMDWDGMDSVLIKPVITNLAAVQASKQPDVHYSWVIEDGDMDTSWQEGGLMLKKAGMQGDFTVNLCLDNNGPATCKSMIVSVKVPTGLKTRPLAGSVPAVSRPEYDAAGRRLDGSPWRRAPSLTGFLR